MTIEKIATLIWRFIGLFIVLTALPAAVMLLRGILAGIGRIGDHPYLLGAQVGPLLFVSSQIIVGVLVYRFSAFMGRVIARGL